MVWIVNKGGSMTLRDPILALHIAAGSTALILGPMAMRAPKRPGRHPRIGTIYHWVMLTVCLSAAAMALLAFKRIWWFLPIATFSYLNALVAYLAAKRRRPGWLPIHIGGMCGSYIALVTALLVVNLGTTAPVAWALPTIIGTPLIIRTRRRYGTPPRRSAAKPEQGESVRADQARQRNIARA
jgi:uncharacterized membrane protein